MPKTRRVAILTGGGDCPGLNAVLRAVVKTAQNEHGMEVWGVRNGAEGFLKPRDEGIVRLDRAAIAGILPRGGTILGASNRCDPFRIPSARGSTRDLSERIPKLLNRKGIEALIMVGGDGTQRMGLALQEAHGVNIVGVPKTIDNDLSGTDRTFGFDTAISVVSEAIDRLYTTAESHHRVILVEVMGRDSGFIALHGGLAGGCEAILLPEIPYDPDRLAAKVEARVRHGRRFSVIVVAEGARRAGGHLVFLPGESGPGNAKRLGGISFEVAEELRERTRLQVRNVVLGHTQRGGTPTAYDRVLATRMGCHAVDLVAEKNYGRMVALKGTSIKSVTLETATRRVKKIPPKGELVRAARQMGISFAAADGSDDHHLELRHRFGAP